MAFRPLAMEMQLQYRHTFITAIEAEESDECCKRARSLPPMGSQQYEMTEAQLKERAMEAGASGNHRKSIQTAIVVSLNLELVLCVCVFCLC